MNKIKYITVALFALVFSLSSYSQTELFSEVDLIIERDAKETSRNGVKGFCSFTTSPYVYRFIVKTSDNESFYKAITHVQISRKGSKNNPVSTYEFIGLNKVIEIGREGTKYRVFEKIDTKTNLPRYFYHASHTGYTRDEHFFANKINVANGLPERIDEARFYAELDKTSYQYMEAFICGYEL